MSIPAFLTSSFFYFERVNVTDVATIISDFQAQVLANVPVWTNPLGGVFVSPVDSSGRFLKVALTRVNATDLTVVVSDQNSIAIASRMIRISATNGTQVRIFTGQFHFAIDCNVGTSSPEFVVGGILDESPESQSTHTRYVWATGPRTADGSTYTDYHWEYYSMLDNVTPAFYRRVCMYLAPISGYPSPVIDSLGFFISQPILMYTFKDAGAYQYYAGRAYQMVFISSLSGGAGTEITLPVDAGVTGVFKILSGDGYTSSPSNGWVVAVRIA